MTATTRNRPEGSNWGEFGPDDQIGRLSYLTPEKVLQGVAEVRAGLVFSLSLPLDLPGGSVLNPARKPPVLRPTERADGTQIFLHAFACDHNTTDVACDDQVTLSLQYSTQWDGFSHIGSHFDADGDGKAEVIFYNGHGAEYFHKQDGTSRAARLGIEHMAKKGVQGRAVMVDLRAHLGDARVAVGYDQFRQIMDADGVEIEKGDILVVHTGFADLIFGMNGQPDAERLARSCAVLDGFDPALRQWVDRSGIAAIACDNYAVEHRPYDYHGDGHSALLPLHELCLFKLGIHLGELWHLTPLANWLRANGRNRFLLTAPPLHLPGAVGSPLNPIATV